MFDTVASCSICEVSFLKIFKGIVSERETLSKIKVSHSTLDLACAALGE